MSCRKTNQEIEKQINVEQEFADLRFKDMRSARYGLSPCCPLEKLERMTSKKEICDWDNKKLPVYNDKSYKDSTDTGYESYKWLFENATIPDWVQKICRPCDPLSSTVIVTTSIMTVNFSAAVIDADTYLVRDKTKIWILAKYDGIISADQTNTYFTVGYGVVPEAAGSDLSIIVYGNTNTADPKNGADENEVLTVIIDKNGDGTELYQIDTTTITGWNPNIFQVTTIRTLTNFGDKTSWCTYGISTDCTFCGEIRKEDLDLYFFYDGTSMGVDAIKQAWEIGEEWIIALRAIGAFNGNVYHTVVAGERWLDWAIIPYTGAYNNSGTCGGKDSPAYTTPDHGDGLSTGYVDAINPSNTAGILWGIMDYFQNVITDAPIPFYGGLDITTTNTYTGAGASGQPSISMGPPPKLQNKEILVVCFADESTSNVATGGSHAQPYHSKSSNKPTWALATSNATGSCPTCLPGVPTPCWKADYAKFVLEHDNHIAKGSDYIANYFLYVSRPAGGGVPGDAREQFPLHALGAITSGDNPVGSGILTTAPVSTVADGGDVDGLDAVETGPNPYVVANVGKLDAKGWGYNVDAPVAGFTKDHFVSNLEEFWTPGEEECYNDAECLIIYVKDDEGNAVECYPIYIDNREVGMTDEDGLYVHTEYFSSANTNHSIDICHCFTTTGGCDQQRIDITVTPETAKVICTPLTVDCTPET
jgi:hypothetical protein